jgi:hypothetical protein
MGKQIRFYMTASEEDEFVHFAASSGDVILLPKTSAMKSPNGFRSFQEPSAEALGDSCHIWNKTCSPPPIYEYVQSQGQFWLNFKESEVINLMRSRIAKDRMTMGRLQIDPFTERSDGSVVPKSELFMKWYDNLAKWIRKFCPMKVNGAYVSPGAKALADAGIELSGHW